MNSTPKFDSISHFLQSGGFNYHVFDMGRKVTPIPKQLFEQIESQQVIYPYPFQQKAWIALLFWPEDSKNTKNKESVIWFLQFPVDELGYLKQDARDGFLISLLEQTGKNIQAKQHGESLQDELTESPYAFKPQPDRLAIFHAFSTRLLDQKPSQYYQFAQDYLAGDTGYDQWQFLGMQGVADVVARLDEDNLDEDNNEALLAKAINKLPEVPLEIFSQMLEHAHPDKDLTDELSKRLEQELSKEQPNNKIVAALIRGLSGRQDGKKRKEMLKKVLSSDLAKDIEVLVAISGRSWEDLKDSTLLENFINQLAEQNQAAFNAILSDLIRLPDMRPLVMKILKRAQQTNALKDRMTQFMQTFGSPA